MRETSAQTAVLPQLQADVPNACFAHGVQFGDQAIASRAPAKAETLQRRGLVLIQAQVIV
ncbi:hypothetical protein [Janthinobacterium sp. 64]|uniref:hypothetical protein n=1 Tax=Janthinobacterium sp. 64 TaxID=2035208 RepID=UPI000C2C9EE4